MRCLLVTLVLVAAAAGDRFRSVMVGGDTDWAAVAAGGGDNCDICTHGGQGPHTHSSSSSHHQSSHSSAQSYGSENEDQLSGRFDSDMWRRIQEMERRMKDRIEGDLQGVGGHQYRSSWSESRRFTSSGDGSYQPGRRQPNIGHASSGSSGAVTTYSRQETQFTFDNGTHTTTITSFHSSDQVPQYRLVLTRNSDGAVLNRETLSEAEYQVRKQTFYQVDGQVGFRAGSFDEQGRYLGRLGNPEGHRDDRGHRNRGSYRVEFSSEETTYTFTNGSHTTKITGKRSSRGRPEYHLLVTRNVDGAPVERDNLSEREFNRRRHIYSQHDGFSEAFGEDSSHQLGRGERQGHATDRRTVNTRYSSRYHVSYSSDETKYVYTNGTHTTTITGKKSRDGRPVYEVVVVRDSDGATLERDLLDEYDFNRRKHLYNDYIGFVKTFGDATSTGRHQERLNTSYRSRYHVTYSGDETKYVHNNETHTTTITRKPSRDGRRTVYEIVVVRDWDGATVQSDLLNEYDFNRRKHIYDDYIGFLKTFENTATSGRDSTHQQQFNTGYRSRYQVTYSIDETKYVYTNGTHTTTITGKKSRDGRPVYEVVVVRDSDGATLERDLLNEYDFNRRKQIYSDYIGFVKTFGDATSTGRHQERLNTSYRSRYHVTYSGDETKYVHNNETHTTTITRKPSRDGRRTVYEIVVVRDSDGATMQRDLLSEYDFNRRKYIYSEYIGFSKTFADSFDTGRDSTRRQDTEHQQTGYRSRFHVTYSSEETKYVHTDGTHTTTITGKRSRDGRPVYEVEVVRDSDGTTVERVTLNEYDFNRRKSAYGDYIGFAKVFGDQSTDGGIGQIGRAAHRQRYHTTYSSEEMTYTFDNGTHTTTITGTRSSEGRPQYQLVVARNVDGATVDRETLTESEFNRRKQGFSNFEGFTDTFGGVGSSGTSSHFFETSERRYQTSSDVKCVCVPFSQCPGEDVVLTSTASCSVDKVCCKSQPTKPKPYFPTKKPTTSSTHYRDERRRVETSRQETTCYCSPRATCPFSDRVYATSASRQCSPDQVCCRRPPAPEPEPPIFRPPVTPPEPVHRPTPPSLDCICVPRPDCSFGDRVFSLQALEYCKRPTVCCKPGSSVPIPEPEPSGPYVPGGSTTYTRREQHESRRVVQQGGSPGGGHYVQQTLDQPDLSGLHSVISQMNGAGRTEGTQRESHRRVESSYSSESSNLGGSHYGTSHTAPGSYQSTGTGGYNYQQQSSTSHGSGREPVGAVGSGQSLSSSHTYSSRRTVNSGSSDMSGGLHGSNFGQPAASQHGSSSSRFSSFSSSDHSQHASGTGYGSSHDTGGSLHSGTPVTYGQSSSSSSSYSSRSSSEPSGMQHGSESSMPSGGQYSYQYRSTSPLQAGGATFRQTTTYNHQIEQQPVSTHQQRYKRGFTDFFSSGEPNYIDPRLDQSCVCVPFYQCEDGNVIAHGADLLDIWYGPRKQCSGFKVCCDVPFEKIRRVEAASGVESGVMTRITNKVRDIFPGSHSHGSSGTHLTPGQNPCICVSSYQCQSGSLSLSQSQTVDRRQISLTGRCNYDLEVCCPVQQDYIRPPPPCQCVDYNRCSPADIRDVSIPEITLPRCHASQVCCATKSHGGQGSHGSHIPGGSGSHGSHIPGGSGSHGSHIPGGSGSHGSHIPGGSGPYGPGGLIPDSHATDYDHFKFCKSYPLSVACVHSRQLNSLPTLRESPYFDPVADAQRLRSAMGYFNADDEVLIEVLAKRTFRQRALIKEAYERLYGKGKLYDDITRTTRGKFENLMQELIEAPSYYEYLAEELHEGLDRIGTDEDVVLETLISSTNDEIRTIKQIYYNKFGSSLLDDVKSDLSGHLEDLVVALVNETRDPSFHVNPAKARDEAAALYSAGGGRLGTEEETFKYYLTHENYPQLALVFSEYERLAGESFEEALEDEFSRHMEDAVLAIVRVTRSLPRYFADRVHDALWGRVLSKDDSSLVRILVSRAEIDLGTIAQEYRIKYGRDLADDIELKTTGDYEDGLLALLGKHST